MEHFMERFVRETGIEELNPAHLRAVLEWATHRLTIRLLERTMSVDQDRDAKLLVGKLDRLKTEDLVQILDPEDEPEAEAPTGAPGVSDAPADVTKAVAEEEDRLIAEASPLRLLVEGQVGESIANDPSPSRSPSLFVSYSHADKRFTSRLCKDLEERGFAVWRDERDIRVGDSLAESIRLGIDQADYVLPILSPKSIDSPWVRREIDVALNAELAGQLKGILPILRDAVDPPSLLRGKRYADFRPRRYAQGLEALLDALDHDLDGMALLAGAIVRAKSIPGIVDHLHGLGWKRQPSWKPTPLRVEITGGYLSRLRGNADALNDKPSVFIPHSPLGLNPTFPVLVGHGTQIAFGHMQRPSDGGPLQPGIIASKDVVAAFPEWKNTVYIAGDSQHVRAATLLIATCPITHYGARCDLETVLDWWRTPTVPGPTGSIVYATNYFPATTVLTNDP